MREEGAACCAAMVSYDTICTIPYMLLLSIPIIGVCKKPSYDETEASCMILLVTLRLQCFREMGGGEEGLIASLTLCSLQYSFPYRIAISSYAR